MQLYDDRATFLLPRPTWVNDSDVASCTSCNNAFGPLNRRHHCRNCGNIFCHDCSNRKVPLPQLGYGTKPVRVCNGCFDVAYLVTYAIDEDHGVSTQAHGIRGLLELAEKDEEKDLYNMVAYGGIDALIWLLRSSKNTKLHHLSTTILAMLSEKEFIRPVLITKWALAALVIIIGNYTTLETTVRRPNTKPASTSSIHSAASPSLSSNQSSEATNSSIESPQGFILEIVMNCTHVIYQLSRANILSQKELFTDGVLPSLLMLVSFNMQNLKLESFVIEGSPTITPTTDENDQSFVDNITIIQTLAAKSISSISSLVPFKEKIIQSIQSTSTMPSLLRSTNEDVQKYAAKTIAYLSLRNDQYKPLLLAGEGAPALLSILVKLPQKADIKIDEESRFKDLAYYFSKNIDVITSEHKSLHKKDGEVTSNATVVSHVCCALANFATNNESQMNLLSQPHLLQYICNVPLVFPDNTEIHRHVARCIANLALYEENNQAMLSSGKKFGDKDGYNVIPTLLFMSKTTKPDIQRHIVRAIDNLSSNLSPKNDLPIQWEELFKDAHAYIKRFLEATTEGDETDNDTYKRAKNILARKKLESEQQKPNNDSISEEKLPAKEEGENNTTVENSSLNEDDKVSDLPAENTETHISSTPVTSQSNSFHEDVEDDTQLDPSLQTHSSAEDEGKDTKRKSKNKRRSRKHK